MKHILVLGAGKSATVLIEYLIRRAPEDNTHVHVADLDPDLCREKIGGLPHATPHRIIPEDPAHTFSLINTADLVISMLPPPLHAGIARDCLRAGCHFLNASYLSEELLGLDADARARGLTFLCELGLDPGIDHMSAMELIDGIRSEGGQINLFRSHCGGLIAPECDDNPWHYKISWNPRNVVMAGKDGAVYRDAGKIRKVSYAELFDPVRTVEIPGLGRYAWYPNRDSLSYLHTYGLEDVDTFVRTTLRHPDFCFGWRNIIQLGLTDDDVRYDTNGMSLSSFFQIHFDRFGFSDWLQRTISDSFMQTSTHLQDLIRLLEADSLRSGEERAQDRIMLVDEAGDLRDWSKHGAHQAATAGIAHRMHEAKLSLSQLFFLGLDSAEMINQGDRSAAWILQWIIEKRLALKDRDRDMIVMMHEVGYKRSGQAWHAESSLILKGDDQRHTAMARTVGLPLAIAARAILNGSLKMPGVHIPVSDNIYRPLLRELEREGIRFVHNLRRKD
ncbi:MAG: saccharopine dehydrogenase NADP-binding domain-containing protein [Chitinophagaceae bacterium]|nr:saccharopine dehydrogenase NADP-binding domain-containing protein [Chitinophagaceae bacterium]